MTLGDLFDSYDYSKIHSEPGVRWDLFPGAEQEGRKRLVMDFFGNVQGVEVEGAGAYNETEWIEDLRRLREIMRKQEALLSGNSTSAEPKGRQASRSPSSPLSSSREKRKFEGAARVETDTSWSQRVIGGAVLLGCALVWGGAGWMEGKR